MQRKKRAATNKVNISSRLHKSDNITSFNDNNKGVILLKINRLDKRKKVKENEGNITTSEFNFNKFNLGNKSRFGNINEIKI